MFLTRGPFTIENHIQRANSFQISTIMEERAMTTSDLFDDLPRLNKDVVFTPTRAAGLAQLESFV